MKTKTILCHLASAALLTISIGSRAEASFIVNIVQSGSDVVATGSGSLNISGMSGPTSINNVASIQGSSYGEGILALGPTSASASFYSTSISGPSFGSSTFTDASSGSGDPVALDGGFGQITVPTGYVSEASLSDTSTWDSTTIAGLGLTPGSYQFTWGSGANADSFTVDIQGAAPEPASWYLLSLGGIVLALHRFRKCVRA